MPGYHLNPNKGFKRVSPAGGDLFLYRQCLTGDSVDNIGGCYKCGPAKAKRILDEPMPPAEMWELVVEEYELSMEKYPDHYPSNMTAADVALENMRLVYLRREEDEIWTPPKDV